MMKPSTRNAGLASVIGLLFLAGCGIVRQKTPVPLITLPTAAPAETPAAELTMRVDSVPPGAVIVVDGRPMGRAPVRFAVPATAQGFFRDYMEIRARFVATDEGGVSRTATEEFTPREKVPAELRFTPDGAQRTLR